MKGSPIVIRKLTFDLPDKFAVRFADGGDFHPSVAVFEMPVDRLRWDTLRVVPGGKAITVTDVVGEPLVIDAQTVRYYVDPEYAKQVKARRAGKRLTRGELAEIARNSDPRPSPQPEGGFYRAAWK